MNFCQKFVRRFFSFRRQQNALKCFRCFFKFAAPRRFDSCLQTIFSKPEFCAAAEKVKIKKIKNKTRII